MKKGFIESFTSISSILHNKSARSSASISTQSSFFLRFDFLAKMFPELYFRRMSEKISRPYNSLVSLDMKFLSFKTLSWRMPLPLYLISHKNFFNKKDCFDCKNCPLFWHALCAFSCKSVWRGLSLLEEAVTVTEKIFDTHFISRSFRNIQELLRFCIARTFPLDRGSCFGSLFRLKKIFLFYPFFIYAFFILRFPWFEIEIFLAVFMICQGMIP